MSSNNTPTFLVCFDVSPFPISITFFVILEIKQKATNLVLFLVPGDVKTK